MFRFLLVANQTIGWHFIWPLWAGKVTEIVQSSSPQDSPSVFAVGLRGDV